MAKSCREYGGNGAHNLLFWPLPKFKQASDTRGFSLLINDNRRASFVSLMDTFEAAHLSVDDNSKPCVSKNQKKYKKNNFVVF